LLHATPISFFSILSPARYWVRITDHSAPYYVTFSIPPYLVPLSRPPLPPGNTPGTHFCYSDNTTTTTTIIIIIIVIICLVRVIKSRRMRWAGHVARMGEERSVYRVLVGNPEGKRPLGRPRRRWKDNIRMYLKEVGCGCVDWIGLAQDGTGGGHL
jgi:hypothetical protein